VLGEHRLSRRLDRHVADGLSDRFADGNVDVVVISGRRRAARRRRGSRWWP
jgi:hypothetical protein